MQNKKVKIGNIGSYVYNKLPLLIRNVIDEDLEALEKAQKQGADLNEHIILEKEYSSWLTPLGCAFVMGKEKAIYWLIEHGADLNDEQSPAFLDAVRYCDEKIIRFVAEKGAKLDAKNSVGTNVYEAALYGDKFENFEVIDSLGLSVKKYGGAAFRSAVCGSAVSITNTKEEWAAIEYFISKGVDINYNKPDMVNPQSPTPLCIAARYKSLKLCKYLVEHGADVTMVEKDGMRPYSIAVERGDEKMAEYFKSIEPAEFHSKQNKKDQLKSYQLPKELTAFLEGDNLELKSKTKCDIKWIRCFNLLDTVPMKYGRQKLLRISAETDNYSDFLIVWIPKNKMIGIYDEEHEELTPIAKAKDFLADFGKLINEKMW